MVEIKYKDCYEVADLAGQTVKDVREQFKAEFGIPDKARARLNGKKIKESSEPDTVLNQDGKLSFAVAKSRGAYLVGALLLALAVTGGIFAYGFTNASTSLTANIANSNFADVSESPDSSNINWSVSGLSKGTIDAPHGIFNITPGTGYTGDLVVTVTLSNVDQLVKVYRTLALKLEMVNSSDNSTIDINESGTADSNDWVLLTLDNALVSMIIQGTDNTTVRVKGGYYVTQARPFAGWQGSASPDLFCEVAQGAATSAAPVTVASQVSYYSLNTVSFNSANFTRSLTPMSVTAGNANASQSINQDGSVSLAISNSPGYADSGFYLYAGTLGNLNSIQFQASNNSGPFAVNIWFDKDNNGECFTWINNVYQGVGNDAYILGPGSQNGVLAINSGSQFTSLIPGGGNYTLAQLKSGAAPGINSSTRIAIWVGISVNSGSQNATVQSVSIN
jgi:hypothetical protein